MMNKNVKIAMQLLWLAKSLVANEKFNFVTMNDFGPDNAIEVAKSDVFAHQLTNDDVAKIQGMESREGKYDDSYKVAGNWICTAKVGEDAGEFWIVKDAKMFREKTERLHFGLGMTSPKRMVAFLLPPLSVSSHLSNLHSEALSYDWNDSW